jgi:starvation-inducible DNA-binding protein
MEQDFLWAIKTGFASEYAFLVKAQNAHWNVEGRMFGEDHALFERIYTEVEESIDTFAENIRKVQGFVPAALGQMKELSVIEDFTADSLPSVVLYQTLLTDSDTLAQLFSALFDLAEQNHEHGLSNFLADRQDAHRQHSWMLRASLKSS